MLQITRTPLIPIDNPYAVGYLQLNDQLWGVCASGSRGAGVAFPAEHPELAAEQKLSAANWGAQMFCQVDDTSYFSIQGFLPEYQCEGAHMVRVSKNGENWNVEKCFDMPFLHKIAIVDVLGHPWLIGATLSGPKDFKEDWSKPGEVVIAPVPEDPVSGKWEFRQLLYPMTKNHGFCKAKVAGREVVYISATEGTWMVLPPTAEGEDWQTKKVLDFEIGDLTVDPLTGDMAAVVGFHGDEFTFYQGLGTNDLKPVFSEPIKWGHTAWLGQVGGVPVVVAGELFGKARILFYADCGNGYQLVHEEENIGPFSVTPRQVDASTLELLCPARAAGCPIIYRLQKI